MANYKQIGASKKRYCYIKKPHLLSEFPPKLAITPGICAPPLYNCFERIPENKSSLSIHVKPMHSEQIGSGHEQLTANVEEPVLNTNKTEESSAEKNEDKDLQTILFKMAHPVYHVKEESDNLKTKNLEPANKSFGEKSLNVENKKKNWKKNTSL